MKIHSSTQRIFRYDDCPTEVPDSLLNEEWAQQIHGQTLARLNHRGGMCINEILANIKRIPYREIKEESVEMLIELKQIIKNNGTNTKN